MGRFYKTSSAKMLDFSFKLPEKLMMKSVQLNDAYVNQELDAYNKYMQALVGQGLGSEDNARMKQILGGYNKRVQQGVNQISKNPLQWRSYAGNIRQIGSDIFKDKTTGEWGDIQGNYNSFQAWSKELDDYSKKSPDKFTPQDMQKLKTYAYINWGGTKYDKNTGTGRSFSGIGPAEYVDINALGDLEGKGFKADANTTYNVTSDGRYLMSTVNGVKEVSEKQVMDAVTRTISNNPKALAYMKQRYKIDKGLGLISDNTYLPTDKKGNPIPLDPNNPNAGLVNYMNYQIRNSAIAAAEKYGFRETTIGIKSKTADPYTLENAKFKHSKALYRYKKGIINQFTASNTDSYVFDKNTFNPQGVQESINTTKKLIADDQAKLAQYQKQVVNLTGIKQIELNGEITNLKNSIADNMDLLAQQKAIGANANKGAFDKLLADGVSYEDAKFYTGNYYHNKDNIKRDERIFQRTPGNSNLVLNVAAGFSNTGSTPRSFNSHQAIITGLMKANGVSEQRAEEIYDNHLLFKKYDNIGKQYGKNLNNWYATNANQNHMQITGINTEGLKNDAGFNNMMSAYIYNGTGRIINTNTTVLGQNDATKVRKKGIMRKQNVFSFQQLDKTSGSSFSDYGTVTNISNLGNKTLVNVRIDPNKFKNGTKFVKNSDKTPYTITVEYDNNQSDIGYAVNNYLHNQGYAPASQDAAIADYTLTPGPAQDIRNLQTIYSTSIVKVGNVGVEKSTPYHISWGNSNQDVTVSDVNGSPVYYVTTYNPKYITKDNPEGKVGYKDDNGNMNYVAEYSGSNAFTNMAFHLVSLNRALNGQPELNLSWDNN